MVKIDVKDKDIKAPFSKAEVAILANRMGVDFDEMDITVEQLQDGMAHELEHSGLTHGDASETASIALDHLKEDPEYYTKLDKIEASFSTISSKILDIADRLELKGFKAEAGSIYDLVEKIAGDEGQGRLQQFMDWAKTKFKPRHYGTTNKELDQIGQEGPAQEESKPAPEFTVKGKKYAKKSDLLADLTKKVLTYDEFVQAATDYFAKVDAPVAEKIKAGSFSARSNLAMEELMKNKALS